MSASSPEPQSPSEPERFTVPIAGGALAGWRWVNPGAPALLFSHATGFCASAYKQALTALAGRFEIWALDLRGHGRTRLPADPRRLRSWAVYAEDIAAFLDNQPERRWVLAGHSMGATSSLLAAKGRSDIAGLALIEPVAIPPHLIGLAHTPLWALYKRRIPHVRLAENRRNLWPDRETARSAYARAALFASWAAGALEDYLEDGLIEDGDSVRLACDSEWEAATFAAQANKVWSAAAAAPAPLVIIAAGHASSTLLGRAHERFRQVGATIDALEGVTHLAPFEKPVLVAERLQGAVGRMIWPDLC